MSIVTLLRRLLLFILALALPFAVIGLSLAWIKGLIVAEGVLLLIFWVVAATAEKGILKTYRVQEVAPSGAVRSLARVMTQVAGEEPGVRVFSDPAPQALVARGLNSTGVILLSEGLLGLLSEDELRALLKVCLIRLRARGMVFQTLCAWMAHLTFKMAPQSWLSLLLGEAHREGHLGALDALRFLPVLSTARFFMTVGRTPVALQESYRLNAPHAFVQLSQLTGEVTNPGSCILHLVDPWRLRSLIPL